MNNLSLEKFNPKKSELAKLSKKFSTLTIKNVDDTAGYLAVDSARKELKKQQSSIERQGKEFRAEAIKFQKDVIAYEKELVAIIEPVKLELQAKQDVIDLEKHKLKMLALLPDRKARLAEIVMEESISDDEILSMNTDEFNSFFNEQKGVYLEAKEAQLKADQDKIDEEKRIQKAKEDTRKEEAKKAERDILLAKEKAELEKNEIKRKAEKEKQDIIDENNRKEQARLKKEEDARKESEEKVKIALEEKVKLEKQKKYQDFLKKNEYSKVDCYLLDIGKTIILYKKVAEFIK